MSDPRVLRTAWLVLAPVAPGDEEQLVRFHADQRVMATMRHGPLDPDAAQALARSYAADWPARGWGVRVIRRADGLAFIGICGLWQREDGRGIALRFAIVPEAQGLGFAREAASATIADGFARVGLERIVSVARETNLASWRALEAVGFRLFERFANGGIELRLYAVTPAGALSSACRPAAGEHAAGR